MVLNTLGAGRWGGSVPLKPSSKPLSFLLLQGVSSPFFARLADALECSGHKVHKVNFSAGDLAFWFPRKNRTHFRDDTRQLPAFLEHIWQRHGITDQILFGDRRPIHRAAVEKAERFGVRTHVFEEGYFRPFWVTLEREGVNGHSLLPRDPGWFRAAAQLIDKQPTQTPEQFHSAFRKRAGYDVLYHVVGALNPLLNPRYRNHASITAPVVYAGYMARFARLPLWRKRDTQLINRLCEEASRHPFFLLPLQLNTDAQIHHHSRFDNMQEVIEYVLASFAKHAPATARILIKNHPLDMGLVNYPRLIKKLTKHFNLAGRVEYIETGDLEQSLRSAAGTVTVNSTVGITALENRCPTLCLSDPIYNLPGLTDQSDMDDFWQNPMHPDQNLFQAFRDVVLFATQVNGGFYCHHGISLAAENAADILCSQQSPLGYLLETCPP
ncbi:MAG: capsular biosynthesis protein [Alteromonadaceae bacterium]|nr:capsular biosynthesis protein [Alteromonadaceae bacterium]